MGTSPGQGLSPGKHFGLITCLFSKENVETVVLWDPEPKEGQKRRKCSVCPFLKFRPSLGDVEGWWGCGGRQCCPWAQLNCVMGDEGQVGRVGGRQPGGAGEETSLLVSQEERAPQVFCSAVGWRNTCFSRRKACGLWMVRRGLPGCCRGGGPSSSLLCCSLLGAVSR